MDFFINMDDGINNHFTVREHANAASGVNWPITVAKLIPRDGPQPGRLEINAHGNPASIQLVPPVNHTNVGQFAALISRLLRPGGTIEILSCSVGSFPASLATAAGVITEERQNAFYKEARAHRRHDARLSPMPMATFTAAEMTTMANAAIQAPRAAMSQQDYDWNGALFCVNLAALTGCRVRAAMYTQTEEDERSGNRHYLTPFGNWDGHVFDYMPDRTARYVGFNVSRPVFRTYDQHGDGPVRLS